MANQPTSREISTLEMVHYPVNELDLRCEAAGCSHLAQTCAVSIVDGRSWLWCPDHV